MLRINRHLYIDEDKIIISAVRSQGAGGQNVNKVSTAIQLQFSITESDLPTDLQERLLEFPDRRISAAGVITIKAQRFRTQEKNRADAMERLTELILKAAEVPVKRVATKPTRSSRRARTDAKVHRGGIKELRRKIKGGSEE